MAVQHSPIILLGMPRSGTTWLGKIFDSHPDTAYRHEPDSVEPYQNIPLLAETAKAAHYEEDIRSGIEQLSDLRTVKTVGKLPLFRKNYFSPLGFFLYRTTVLAQKALDAYGVHVPTIWWRKQNADVRLVYKSIESVGRLGVLATVLPESPILLMTRHPMGYICSVLRGESKAQFAESAPSAEDMHAYGLLLETQVAKKYEFTLEKLIQMNPIERLAVRWMLYNEKALDEASAFNRVMDFKYEDLCADPISVSKQLMRFCQLSWDAQIEQFLSASTSRSDQAYYSVFKDPLVSANRWRDEMSAEEMEQAWNIIQLSPLAARYPESEWRHS